MSQSEVAIKAVQQTEESEVLEILDDQTVDNELNYQEVRQSKTGNKPVSITTEDLF